MTSGDKEDITTNNHVTVNLQVVLKVNNDKGLKLIEDHRGIPYGVSMGDKKYYPILCFECVNDETILYSDKQIDEILGVERIIYTPECNITVESNNDN